MLHWLTIRLPPQGSVFTLNQAMYIIILKSNQHWCGFSRCRPWPKTKCVYSWFCILISPRIAFFYIEMIPDSSPILAPSQTIYQDFKTASKYKLTFWETSQLFQIENMTTTNWSNDKIVLWSLVLDTGICITVMRNKTKKEKKKRTPNRHCKNYNCPDNTKREIWKEKTRH